MAGGQDRDGTVSAFKDLVNIPPAQLEKWLERDESKKAGQHRDGGESTGHASGRRIVGLLRTRKADLSEDDLAHMRKVCGYIRRHLTQRPSGDVTDTTWRYSLMNWGHDPLKD
ncbi:DUF3140 domain-containing protein [Streptacidiphilus sp. ASG 303]|uniref:DUF3140 domain-containing protein n=1 Tax=Streptacidiphilus sp. ASG 303 TaxID=2896847 RepID=UPI001E5EC50D|nr:DUF3140 domain-containing protein [Streptacidiphilus sp. ASG 303]MCD0485424.1 DUF3140 domain-containing protein [Streptacidiphilus sp. ASG 303]